MATIKDIAKKANVSVSTVSLVINNKGYVAASTRERIIKTIQEMNYKPLHSARKLATGKTGNLGYIVWSAHFTEIENFYSQIFLGMEYAAQDSDRYILLTTVKEDFDPKTDLPRFLKYNDVDGVALAGRVPHSLIRYLEKQGIPLVLVDYGIPDKNYNSVLIDNFNGAYQATQHLIESGYQKIGFVTGTFFHPSIKERYRGYKAALAKAGISDPKVIKKYSYLVAIETSPKIGQEGTLQLLSKQPRPDAIFCGNDSTALGALQELKRQQLKIPEDVALVGFDDIPSAGFSSPSLTTVEVPKLTIGKEAYKLLADMIDKPVSPPQTRTISVKLIKRESS